ncbi:MAG: phosphate acyltransferase [Syntrophales bacterium]|nr:phosphate acyltransferase [Syntrophales bacterium]
MVVLAPEDEEFMKAVKMSWEMGYIEPILIGNTKKMEIIAEKAAFNIDGFRKIPVSEQQDISDLGIKMLFEGETPIASKGQIPTSFIYRSIIREEAKSGSGMNVSVISFWEIPGIDHLVAFTDTGVNIKPDLKAKAEIIKNAVFVYHLMGYQRPKIAVLSGQREVGGTLASYTDYEALKRAATVGDFGECEIVAATSFTEIFFGNRNRIADYSQIKGYDMPHILVVPCLDTGNIICKLDLFLDVIRSSLVATSKGPVCIPARSDFSDNIVQQIAMCVAFADRMEKEAH